jgi:hypothetical protein
MASTYSALKIELIGTGEQSGTWGTTTNNNLGNDALGEAITGSADVAFSSANVTVTLTDTNASQAARNLRLNLIGTTGGARDLILGSGCQIEKLYLINNTCADAITVKNTSGTGIAVAAGKSMFVYNNGTNVVDAVTQFNGTIVLTSGVSGVLPVANGGTGASTNAGTAYALKGANSDITSITGLTTPLTVAQGGTGAATLRAATIATLGYTTTATAAGTTTLTATSTATQFFTGSTTQTVVLPVASTMTQGQQFTIHNNSSGNVTVNSSGANLVATLTANVTATITCILTSGTDAASWDADFTGFTTALPVTRGGTGATTFTANSVILGNGTSALSANLVAPGATGNVLTSNGSTWTSAAAAGGGVTSLNSQTGAITNTTQYAIGSYVLGRPANYSTSYNNSTIAGSSLYACSASTAYRSLTNEQSQLTGAAFYYFGQAGVSDENSNTSLVNTGTWRCVSIAGQITGTNNNIVGTTGLWVRTA